MLWLMPVVAYDSENVAASSARVKSPMNESWPKVFFWLYPSLNLFLDICPFGYEFF